MSEKDKTQQKLVDSIRKTKAGAASKSSGSAGKSKTSTSSHRHSSGSTSAFDGVTDDAYQSRGRVWPD